MTTFPPQRIETEAELENVLSMPRPPLVEAMRTLEGDLLILGVGGKMGPSMARLARRALDASGRRNRVIGVARFSDPAARAALEAGDVETITADLLDDAALAALPDCPNVVYLAARKFGSTGDEPLTWAMNTYLPARVAQRYRSSRIVALSTGNVYPLLPVESGGATEETPVGPVGEYAQSCLGRERMFQHFSKVHGTRVAIIRLNYANDLRYGVLLDVAEKVWHGRPVSVAMGHANVIWQGDANAAVLRALDLCSSPPFVLNLTGPETVSVRQLASEFGRRFGREVILTGQEAPTALLSDARLYHRTLGPAEVTLDRLIDWTAHWVQSGGRTLSKPTHFEARDGRF